MWIFTDRLAIARSLFYINPMLLRAITMVFELGGIYHRAGFLSCYNGHVIADAKIPAAESKTNSQQLPKVPFLEGSCFRFFR
jgi:hypothetical protein